MNNIEEISNKEALLSTDESQAPSRVEKALVIILTSFMLFGDSYAYDVPYAVKDDMKVQFPSLTKLEFSYSYDNLYTFYSIPNIFLPLINGYIGLKYGVRRLLTFFIMFNVLGQFVIALGDYLLSFPVMILGRAIYGLGGESLLVFQWAYITEFIPKKETGFAAAVTNLSLNISESADLFISPRISQGLGVAMCYLITAIFCGTDLIARLCLLPIEKKYKSKKDEITQGERINLCPKAKDFKLPALGWIVIFFGLVISDSHYGFFYYSSEYIINAWYSDMPPEQAQDEASYYTSLSTLVYSFGIMIFGWIADKYQLYVHFAVIVPVLLSFSYFLVTIMHPLFPFIFLGLATTLADISLWSCLNQVVPGEKVIMASAIIYSISNASMAVIQDINTFILNKAKSYMAVIWFYHGLNLIGFLGAIWFAYKLRQNKKKLEVEETRETFVHS